MYRRPDGEVGGARRRWRHDEAGQALVEFALVLPLVILLMGVAFNGWNGIQLALRLTSAARAGAIQAANNLATDLANDPSLTPSTMGSALQPAWDKATQAINQEEDTNVYQDSNSMAPYYVNMTETTNGSNPTIYVVTISISRASVTLVPIVGNIAVSAQATARYS